MNRIQVLDKQVAELIAAGEVVERPASAVKELLENAIDAGATAVSLEIKNGGVAFIRVTDNGGGIPKEDAPVAFLRHATSKVRSADDLEAIGTLGFRGEALASISAVSKVELLTRTAGELAGTHLRLEGGEIVESGDAGCPQGTTIIVRELFYNTPARMKFLKKDLSEANAVTAVAQRIALSHPEISLRYIKDGREELYTPGDNRLISAVHAVLGKQFASGLIEVKYEFNHLAVSGYISKPTASRPNRNMQYFFLNGRLVKTRTAMAALEEGYKNSIMTGRFPACVLNIAMDAHLADVNVHPAKLEVRFVNEKDVFDLIYYAAKNALAAGDTRPEYALGERLRGGAPSFAGQKQSPLYDKPFGADKPEEKPAQLRFEAPGPAREQHKEPAGLPDGLVRSAVMQASLREDDGALAVASPAHAAYEPLLRQSLPERNLPGEPLPAPAARPVKAMEPGQAAGRINSADADNALDGTGGAPVTGAAQSAPYRVLGQCFGTYILVEQGGELLLIDKHAAHERILFEQVRSAREASAQLLLTPAAVTLTPAEYAAAVEHLPLLRQAGFDAEDFGGTTLLVRAAPLDLTGEDVSAVVTEIAGALLDNKTDVTPGKLDWLYHSVACRAAIKAGDKTADIEMESLAGRVLQNSDIRYCPHGRPVVISLTKKDIEKQFGRIV